MVHFEEARMTIAKMDLLCKIRERSDASSKLRVRVNVCSVFGVLMPLIFSLESLAVKVEIL